MITIEAQVTMAAKLYQARDTLRRLQGDEYFEKIEPWKSAIIAAAKKWKCSEITAMIRLCKKDSDDGMTVLWLMAAVVEIIEPSEATP